MKVIVVILVISLIGNIAGLYFAYKYFKTNNWLADAEIRLAEKEEVLDMVNQQLPVRLVFMHHSVGRNWLSEGGLKDKLMEHGISVQSATRGCEIGDETDMNHWLGKFQNQMEQILRYDGYAEGNYNDSVENDIIMFKSCYPNSDIGGEGAETGNPYDTSKTLSNYRALFDSLQTIFKKYPTKTFIYVTSPPLVVGKTTPENAKRARAFNNWVKKDFVKNYRQDTELENILVFDLFDVLAGEHNMLKKEYQRRALDSHPNPKGSKEATDKFIEFLKKHKLIS